MITHTRVKKEEQANSCFVASSSIWVASLKIAISYISKIEILQDQLSTSIRFFDSQ